MPVRTIPPGSKIHFVWIDGKTNSFVFRGTDLKGPIFENAIGSELSKMAGSNPAMQFFASVAFKYRPDEPDPAGAAAAACLAGFTPTTSGIGTGEPPSLEKIQHMASVCEGKLAVASGMTPENISAYAPYLGHALVATGVSVDDYQADQKKLALFIANARKEILHKASS